MLPDITIIKSLSEEFNLPGIGQADFTTHLTGAINHLIQNDFSRLVQILYRMDISESRLKEMLAKNNDQDAGPIIAMLLIERESQKILSRANSKRDDDIPEGDKW